LAFWQLAFDLGSMDPEAAEEACFARGALSVTFVDAHDDPVLEPLPGEFRLWPTTRLRALFDDSDVQKLLESLSVALAIPAGNFQLERIADRIWEREWLRDFHAMRFGQRLWICPHHEQVTEPDAVIVHMDPGMAFGTGTHSTTALCLEWLDQHLSPGQSVIDYGCGSGILALAAVKLGARSAHCFDIDPQALIATTDNAQINDIAARIEVCSSAGDLPRNVDLLMANILSGPLIALAASFASLLSPGGRVVLAGLLESEVHDVTQAYGACFDIRPFGKREGWVGLSGKRI
jgi:ribosomal protein L11 methyltransferase